MASRKLEPAERALAYSVFGNSVRYDAVSISDTALEGQVITTHFDGAFTIRWSTGFRNIMGDEGRKATFIHEMTHVWQGCNNGVWSASYQAKSVAAQVREGVRDIVRPRITAAPSRTGIAIGVPPTGSTPANSAVLG